MLRLLRTLLLAIVALVGVALVVLATPPGHLIVAGLIERAAASSGLTVKLSNISGWPPFWLGADKVTLADAEGPFAEIDGLSVNVGMLRLLTGRLALDSASADRVAIERAPELPPSAGGSAAAAFAADSFAIARVELGAALAGRAAVLSASGSFASDSAGGLSARIVANRTDGVSGALSASVTRASGSALPVVKVSLKEGADGILVGLMGRRDGPGYQFDAETTDTNGQLDGSVRLASDGAAHFDGQFTVSPADGGAEKLVLTGSGDLAELTPPDYADLLGGAIAVIVDGDFAAADAASLPRMTIRRGTLTTNTIRAEASGSIGGDAADLALTVDVAKADGGSVRLPGFGQPAEAGALTLKGHVAPKEDRLRLDLTGRITRFALGTASVPGIGLSLAAEAPKRGLAAAKIPFAFRAEADGITTPGGTIASSASAPLVATVGGTYDAEDGGPGAPGQPDGGRREGDV